MKRFIFILICVIPFVKMGWAQMDSNSRLLADTLLSELETTNNRDSLLRELNKFKKFDAETRYRIEREVLAFTERESIEGWKHLFLVKKANRLVQNHQEIEGLKLAFFVLGQIERLELTQKHLLSNCYLVISTGYQNLGAYEKAIEYRKIHLDVTELGKHKLRYFNSTNAIGKMYLTIEKYDSALVYYFKGLKKATDLSQDKKAASMRNNIGLVYFELQEYDSSEKYYRDAINMFKTGTRDIDSVMVGIVGGNLAKCLSLRQKDEIIVLLNSNIRLAEKYEYWSSVCNAYFDLGNLYYEIGEFEKSRIYLDSSFIINQQMSPSVEVGNKRVNILEAYVQIYDTTQQVEKSLEYTKRLLLLNDSLFGKDNSNRVAQELSNIQLVNFQNELEYEKLKVLAKEKEIERLEVEESLSKTQVMLSIVFGLLGVSILLFVLYKLKSDQKKRLAKETHAKELLEAENQFKTERLTQSALSLQRKGEFGKQIIQKISEIDGVDSRSLSSVKLFIQNEIKMDEGLTELESYMEGLNKGFISHLKKGYPNLTENDLKMCALIALNLSLKEISVIKNITPNSVKISKNRLSKKLGLEPGTNLYNFLREYGKKKTT